MDSLLKFLQALGPSRILAMGVVSAGLLGFFYFAFASYSKPQMGLLYANLEPVEASTIVGRLDGLNVPYELRDDGRTLFVPRNQISTIRVSLAGEGLGGNVIGYEIFDRGDSLGTTSFVQNINQVRAIEGELSRTIQEINTIVSARVHIVMPQRELFSREERKPTASIILRSGRGGIHANQVRAIQYLVAAAVPSLEPGRISIVDQNGSLLARVMDSDSAAGILAGLEEKRAGYENRLRNQIESLLEKTVGAGGVRAEVAVEMDMDRVTTTSEVFDPDGQVIRSSTSIEDTSSDTEGGPSTGSPVSVGGNLPDAQAGNGAEQRRTVTGRTEETTNFEISRSTITEVKEPGKILRLSIAVLVDGTYVDNGDGTETYQPRSESELDQIELLVQSSVGYDADRGDQVQVINLQFARPEELAPIEEPFNLLGIDLSGLLELLQVMVFGLVTVMILLMVVRPIVQKIIASIPEAPSPDAVQAQLAAQAEATAAIAGPVTQPSVTAAIAAAAAEGDEDALRTLAKARADGNMPQELSIDAAIDVASVEGRVQGSAIKKVGEIVERHPDESASIVRQWLYSS